MNTTLCQNDRASLQTAREALYGATIAAVALVGAALWATGATGGWAYFFLDASVIAAIIAAHTSDEQLSIARSQMVIDTCG